MTYQLILGDSEVKLKDLPDNSVDSIVTDPPYGLMLMGKKWDYNVPKIEIWRECLRVLKPGGHLLAFASTRTQHRMATTIEDAGFDIRDVLSWNYSSGMPKNHDISKAIDREAGEEREVVGRYTCPEEKPEYTYGRNTGGTEFLSSKEKSNFGGLVTKPATPEAEQWEGWGTALKPACEFITLARKPLSENTIAQNVMKWGTGGINIDGCRVETDEDLSNIKAFGSMPTSKVDGAGFSRPWMEDTQSVLDKQNKAIENMKSKGRYPANLIHDGSDEVLELFPYTKSGKQSAHHKQNVPTTKNVYGQYHTKSLASHADEGSASRFFYCAKTSQSDRNEGLPEGMVNNHPCLKPNSLMRYLCKLVTPPNGTILDPFMGSGSTGKAAVAEGFSFIGVELDTFYVDIARHRIEYATKHIETPIKKPTKKSKPIIVDDGESLF